MDALLEFAAAGPVMMTTPPPEAWIVALYANDKGDIFEVKRNWWNRPDGTPTNIIYVVRRSTKFDYYFVRFIGDDHDVIMRKVTRRGGEVELVRLTFVQIASTRQ